MCEWFDETCGELLDFLDERKIADNTIVVFLADNGWIQDPAADRYAPRSKQSPYDGGLRTPILIRWPSRVAPRNSDNLASAIDIAPTILKAVGLEPASDLQGVNLLDSQAIASRTAVFGEIFTHNAVNIDDPASSLRYRWIVSGDWKLIVPEPRNEPAATIELFEVAHDPDEIRNLAAEQPRRVRELSARLEKWWPSRTR
jgi:uncharacterized sulfatase